jgi:uncharacterized UPF0160 family protein
MKSILGDDISVGTHNGVMHADEVFSIATLLFLNPNIRIVRTRDPDLLKELDFRIDVGGKYDPDTGDFDHHQNDFDVRHTSPNSARYERGPKKSGFGLVWEHYGKSAIKKVVDTAFSPLGHDPIDADGVDMIHETITRTLVAPIDAHDNGENRLYYLDTGAYRVPSASSYIQALNPTSAEEALGLQVNAFEDALTYAKKYLYREILRGYSVHLAKFDILDKVKNLPSDGILVLDMYLPWSPIFTKHPQETKAVKMVVFPSSADESWMFQSPYFNKIADSDRFSPTMKDGTRRRHRYPIPEHLYGKTGIDLQELTNVNDAVFVHGNGFLGAAKSKEGAIAIAKYIINHQDQ